MSGKTKIAQIDVKNLMSKKFYSWVSEFVGLPNHGHVALMDLVRDLFLHPNPVLRKKTRKYRVLDRNSVSMHLYISIH